MFSEQTEKQSAARGVHCLQPQNNFPSSSLRAPGLCFALLIPGSAAGGCSQQRIHPAIPWHVWDNSVGAELYLSGDPRWFGVVKTPLLLGNEGFCGNSVKNRMILFLLLRKKRPWWQF